MAVWKYIKKINTIGIGTHPQTEAENKEMQLWPVNNILMIFFLLTPNNGLVITYSKLKKLLISQIIGNFPEPYLRPRRSQNAHLRVLGFFSYPKLDAKFQPNLWHAVHQVADLTWNDPKQPFRYQENFIFSLFSTVQIWFLRGKSLVCNFWLIFWPLDPDSWIRIILRNRIQNAKILRIQGIRILSTV